LFENRLFHHIEKFVNQSQNGFECADRGFRDLLCKSLKEEGYSNRLVKLYDGAYHDYCKQKIREKVSSKYQFFNLDNLEVE